MEIISWNINGLRAIIKKTFYDFIQQISPDILCLQETKIQENQFPKSYNEHQVLKPYYQYHHVALKKGYSGVSILTKLKPLSVLKGLGNKKYDDEGRIITLEYDSFYLSCVYFPNSQQELKRLDYKLKFNKEFLNFIKTLKKKNPVICCGDFNVAHKEIDIKNPKGNTMNPGFHIDERNAFGEFLTAKNDLIDVFRKFKPDEKDAYTWWSYRFKSREKNIGWRIDYFLTNTSLLNKINSCSLLNKIMGSDHCPVALSLKNDTK